MTASLFGFSSEPLAEPLRTLAFTLDEEISRPYTLDAFLVGREDQYAEIEELVGREGELEIRRDDGSVRAQYHGVVASAEFVHALSQHVLFRVVLRPRAWRMSLNERSRVWVDKKIPEVLEDVFKANGLRSGDDYRLELSKTYPVQEHVGQYHESDWDFVSRRMEREGIYFYFEQGDARETLVLVDDVDALALSPEQPVRYFGGGADAAAAEVMHAFGSRHDTVPQQFKTSDYNYLTPTVAIGGSAPVADDGVGVVSVFGGNHLTPGEAARIARLRAAGRAAPRLVYHGRGRVFELRAGYRFELQEHPVVALDRQYLAVRVIQRGSDLAEAKQFAEWLDGAALPGSTEQAVYVSEVFAEGADVVFRPELRTAVPRITGLESARVDAPTESDYAQLDEHGRYRVKILFDESSLKDGKASTWVRMVQPHGGEPEGFHFPLRKGTEVLLSFIGGDPDRPIIVGVGPDADHPSPVTDANHTQNVIMTGGRNRIEIEDLDGSQSIGIYSPPENSTLHLGAHHGPYHQGHNFTLTTDGNGLIHTGGERNITVGARQTEDVVGDLIEDYHANQTTHVFAAFDETIDGGATQVISAGETRTVTGGVTETISGGETRTIHGGQTETIDPSVSRTIAANLTESIGANVTRTIGGSQTETITGALDQTVTGGVNITTPATLTITAAGGMNVTATGGAIFAIPGGITAIDGIYGFEGGIENEYYPMVRAIIGVQLDAAGLSQETNGFKLDVSMNAFGAVGIDGSKNGVEIHQWSDFLKVKALSIVSCGLIIKD